ncbi:carbohydrate ABC transporter substrate-binding protein, CUT1 family [Mesorhizobium albiziae]|uniref:Carbohydrate ABC transporter substrate-binding protein, CUT1 family n=1 Tax=Neomesorhizobium albiziae TaxID=335020 RepID=A0A1I4EKF8_9HYPH|nr:ABC transporter substrate-binding protein [Mesorhizobium albiziae]GLS34373.1 sugar ABC transporter substrate-binding protein [Mesorhizobium albiziae]SFL05769.1 carbohydrate ABC transporter substrate-binding protein, CUT1 family [Mesorhizobium albiziae]
MRLDVYEQLMRMQASRRRVLKQAAVAAALATGSSGGVLGAVARSFAQDGLRAQILKIPGIGAGEPTDADWQKVGELCLGDTKKNVAEGEFAGVELTFMGLNNQNKHNFLFRGFLAPWEAYSGAKINWIDLAQADYNPRLQQSIATGTVDFDIIEMGAPLEGDTAGRGFLDEMPDWVAKQVDADDIVDYLKPPVGTWNGKTYRVTIDGDCHTFFYRKDYLGDGSISGMTNPPDTWAKIKVFSQALKGKKDPLTGRDAYGFLDPLKYTWGGFGYYFLADRAAAYAKHPDDPAWLFDPDTMKPRVNNPAWVRAIQDVMDMMPDEPLDQVNADPNTTASQQFLAGTGGALCWWGDIGSYARTSDTSVVGNVIGFSINPGADEVYNSKTSQWEKPASPNFAPNMAHLGWGIYVTNRVSNDEKKRKAAWSAAAHLGGRDISLWMAAYPSGFQPYRNSHFNYEEWAAAGYDRDYIEDYLGSTAESYNHPNAAIEPRIPGIFQYYSIFEDELVKGIAGQYASAQETADAVAAAWETITDQIGRDSQIKLYKESLGM